MSDTKSRRFLEIVAFSATILVAAALVLQMIFNLVDLRSDVINIVQSIGECIAYLVLCITAFGYVRSKRSTTWYLIYAICVTIIIVLKVLLISLF